MKITRSQLRQIIKEEAEGLNERVTPEQAGAKEKMYKAFFEHLTSPATTELITSFNASQKALYDDLIAKAGELQKQYNPGTYYNLPGDLQTAYDDDSAGLQAVINKINREKGS